MAGGRKQDVLIEQCKREIAGVELPVWGQYKIYADEGMQETIKEVEGVLHCFAFPPPYCVYIDPRYDAEHVIKEIEAAILCKQ